MKAPLLVKRLVQRQDWFESGLFLAFSWALLCLYVAVQIVSSLAAPVGNFDDAIALVSADLVHHGRTPPADFRISYPPLLACLTAAAFRLVGRTVLVPRVFFGALYAAVVIAAARSFWSRFSRLRPLVPFMALLVALSIGSSIRVATWPGSATALLALIAYASAARGSPAGMPWAVVGAGLLAGISSLTRFNFSFYVAVAVGGDLLLRELLDGKAAPAIVRLKRALLPAAAFAIPVGLLNAAFYLWLYGTHAASSLLQILAAARASAGSQRYIDLDLSLRLMGSIVLPFAWFSLRMIFGADRLPGKALIPGIPAACLVGLGFAARSQPSVAVFLPALGLLAVMVLHRFVHRLDRTEVCLLLCYACLLHFYLVRADPPHAQPLLPMVALAVPFLFVLPARPQEEHRERFLGRGQVFVLLLAAIWIIGRKPDAMPDKEMFASGVRLIRSGGLNLRVSDSDRLPAGDLKSPWLSIYPSQKEWRGTGQTYADEWEAVRFVRARTAATEAMFVGVKDHSRVYDNDVRAYWLAGRLPGSRRFELDPGLTTREEVQREIISDLQQNGVNWAILEDATGVGDPAFFRKIRPGSRLLDDFFLTEFQEEACFGRFSVVRRKRF